MFRHVQRCSDMFRDLKKYILDWGSLEKNRAVLKRQGSCSLEKTGQS
jgi:hypothetical protein